MEKKTSEQKLMEYKEKVAKEALKILIKDSQEQIKELESKIDEEEKRSKVLTKNNKKLMKGKLNYITLLLLIFYNTHFART